MEADVFYANDISCSWGYLEYILGAGYRVYSGFPSDQIRAYLDLFYNYGSRKWYLWLQGKLEYGVFNGKRKEHFNQILFNPNYRLFKGAIRFVGFVTPSLYIEGGYFQHLWGENVGTGGGALVGCGYVF